MVSPWMENGNIISYTRKYPEANRLRLVSHQVICQREFNSHRLAVDRRSKWFEVPSPYEFGARGHSGGMSLLSQLLIVTLLKTSIVKYPNR